MGGERITVGNKHAGAVGEYIGRGSPLGNPFKVKPWGPYERGTSIDDYRAHLEAKIAERDPAICAEMNRLYRLARKGPLTLVCFCKPQACHGDVIKEILERELA